jgi:hypothetical protein
MSTTFTRTTTGLVGKWQFYDVPTVWVEGVTDIFFYLPILRDLKCRMEPFHGTGNSDALIEGIKKRDLPYMVILDGDYEILRKKRSVHKRVIVLRRYSFENYLWEPSSLNYSCHRHAQSGERNDVLVSDLKKLLKNLRECLQVAVELDVASQECNPAPKVLPDHIEQFLEKSDAVKIDRRKVTAFIGNAADQIPEEALRQSKQLVEEFLKQRCFSELLKGHLLLSAMHKLFCKKASEIKGGNAAIRVDALVQVLSDSIWAECKGKDHKNLRLKIRKQVKDVLGHPQMAGLVAS